MLLVCLLLVASGCHGLRTERHSYETVDFDPHHDTEAARQHNDEALKWIHKGKWEKAREALEAALIADVTYGPAHNNLGQLYFHQRRFYLAAWEFEYASHLMPDRPEPYNNLGMVYETVGRLPEAIDYYHTAQSFDPENSQVLANLARARIRNGERNPETAILLQEIALRDDRPEWRAWAREQLNTSHLDLATAKYIREAPAETKGTVPPAPVQEWPAAIGVPFHSIEAPLPGPAPADESPPP